MFPARFLLPLSQFVCVLLCAMASIPPASASLSGEAAVDGQKKQKVRRFKCKWCFFEASTARMLHEHSDGEHSVRTLHSCAQCGYKTVWKSALQRHVLTLHSQERSYVCGECSSRFEDEHDLLRHRGRVHGLSSGNGVCGYCGKVFQKRSQLKAHERMTHRNQFPCGECSSSFASRVGLSYHRLRIHVKDKSMACPLCQKTFVRRCDVQRHVKAVHEKLRPHACTDCDYKATDRSQLKRHQRYHELPVSRKAFACQLCVKSYTTQRALDIHTRIVHAKGEERFACTLCSFSTPHSSNLTRHFQNHVTFRDDLMLQVGMELPFFD